MNNEVENAYREYVREFDVNIDGALSHISYAFHNVVRTPDQAREVVRRLLEIDWDTFFVREQTPISLYDWSLRRFRQEQEKEISEERSYWVRNLCICYNCDRFDRNGGFKFWIESDISRYPLCPQCWQAKYDEHVCYCLNCGANYLHTSNTTAVGRNSRNLCTKCYSKELNPHALRLADHLKRASDLGLPATLTLPEWVETVEYFHFSCAYCDGEFQCYEHFVPISSGGGTTKGNCIPSCKRCNLIKNDWNPMTDTPSRFEEARIDYIRQYLSQWS